MYILYQKKIKILIFFLATIFHQKHVAYKKCFFKVNFITLKITQNILHFIATMSGKFLSRFCLLCEEIIKVF